MAMSTPRTAVAGAASPPANRRSGAALALICAAQLMIVLDASIVNVALPTIHTDLHFATADLQWLLTAYSLTFGGLLLLGGRTGDLYGKRRMFLVGVAVFAVASLLGGFATDGAWLIATRGLQGAGAAIASPTGLSLIATTFPEGPERNRALGVYAAMSGAGGAVGLLLGGVLTDLVSWRAVFFVNVPIGAAVLLLAPRLLAESAPTTARRLDAPGAAAATAGMVALVYGLSNTSLHGWGTPSTWGPLAAASVLLACFALIETRSLHALIPLRILADRDRAAAYAMALCLGTSTLSTLFFLTQYLQNVRHWSALATGVGFLPMTAAIVAAAAVASRLVGRVGARVPLAAGSVAAIAAMLWLSRLSVGSGYGGVIGALLLLSVGIGLEFVPFTLLAVRGVRREETGAASALVNTAQQVGGALGLSVLSTVAINAAAHARPSAPGAAATHGYAAAFTVAAGIAVASLLIALLAPRRR